MSIEEEMKLESLNTLILGQIIDQPKNFIFISISFQKIKSISCKNCEVFLSYQCEILTFPFQEVLLWVTILGLDFFFFFYQIRVRLDFIGFDTILDKYNIIAMGNT